MNKPLYWLRGFIFVLCLCVAKNALASPEGSRLAQEKFNQQMFELLANDKLNQAQALMQSIPDCQQAEGAELTPQICTRDRIDGHTFRWHVLQRKSLVGKADFDVITLDAGVYESLGKIYRALYHVQPKEFHRDNYRRFYAKYRGTWLQASVEQTLTQLWQRGEEFKKRNGFSALTGQKIYDMFYISYTAGFEDMFQYVSPEIFLDKWLADGGRRRLKTILSEMTLRSAETNSPILLRLIKNAWLNSVLAPECVDEEEKDYYDGKKLRLMYTMLNEEGWALFADSDMRATPGQKHNVEVYVRACPRLQPAEVCEAFEKGATKYGYYRAPIKHVEPTPAEIIEDINAELREKLRGI